MPTVFSAMRIVALAVTALSSFHVQAAGALVEHYAYAKRFEPLFQAAQAERDANLAGANVARSALYPELRVSASRIETENTPRTTVALVQPLIDANRYATFREGVPREILAQATYQAREHELALRYMQSVSELVRAREGLLLNQVRINAFDEQASSAKRSFELGTGTITDVRDAQVRLNQARATDVTLRARLAAAKRQFAAVTGIIPKEGDFALVRKPPELSLKSTADYLARAVHENAQLIAARQNERIAQLGVTRAKGTFLPTVSATATRTHTSFENDNYVGLQVNFPLQVGSFYQVSAALANAQRFSEQARDVEQRTLLEVERLYQLVEAGRMEVAIRLEGIQSAQLSVLANEKSFNGGIRSKVDVLNSIQTLYQVMQEHLEAVLMLSENLLNLHLQLSHPVSEALQQIEQVLFIPEA